MQKNDTKAKQKKKIFTVTALSLILIMQAGCTVTKKTSIDLPEDNTQEVIEEAQEKEAVKAAEESQQTALNEEPQIYLDSVEVAELYRDIYEQSMQEQTFADDVTRVGEASTDDIAARQETVQRAIIARLGDCGFAATDTENANQVNLTHPEQLIAFNGLVEAGESGSACFFCVAKNCGFIRFDLETAAGEVTVTRSVLLWNGGMPEVTYTDSYPAEGWQYSENGYLFFEEAQPPGYDGAPGYTAVRVQPLDNQCRAYHQKYILPVGYGSNDLFLHDWSEPDFEAVEFDDMFAKLYSVAMGTACPYEKSEESREYFVPEAEYEKVIGTFLRISSERLQAVAEYAQEEDVWGYRYRARGFYDNAESPNTPYPEVVAYEEQEDGTIKLTVNAVWPKAHLDRAFIHEVTVRPESDGGFQYVSNRVISFAEGVEPEWYTERITQ